jgi:hypothetical protein
VIASASLIGIPTVSSLPTSIGVQAWRKLYQTGAASAPPLAVATSAILGFSAWSTRGSAKASLYLGAVVSTMSIVPFTLLVMAGTNGALKGLAAKADKATAAAASKNAKYDSNLDVKDEGVLKELLASWKLLNYVRSLGPLVAAGISLYALLL